MMPSTLTERVRNWIHQALAQATGQEDSPLEAILIRDGFFCGRRFAQGDYEAVWFIEEDQIKLFGPEGQVVQSLVASELGEEATSEPMAESPVKRAA